jgi:hypothetical protein
MKILATTTVRRDDQTSALASLVGAYDEYRAKPQQPTGGSIALKGTPHATLAISAAVRRGIRSGPAS